jgi:hypothetical protein
MIYLVVLAAGCSRFSREFLTSHEMALVHRLEVDDLPRCPCVVITFSPPSYFDIPWFLFRTLGDDLGQSYCLRNSLRHSSRCGTLEQGREPLANGMHTAVTAILVRGVDFMHQPCLLRAVMSVLRLQGHFAVPIFALVHENSFRLQQLFLSTS